jgi:hypothetical protein
MVEIKNQGITMSRVKAIADKYIPSMSIIFKRTD